MTSADLVFLLQHFNVFLGFASIAAALAFTVCMAYRGTPEGEFLARLLAIFFAIAAALSALLAVIF